MSRQMDTARVEAFEVEFDRSVRHDDDSVSKALLAAGRPIHIRRPDTPPHHVVRKYPDGREELVRIDVRNFARRRGSVR